MTPLSFSNMDHCCSEFSVIALQGDPKIPQHNLGTYFSLQNKGKRNRPYTFNANTEQFLTRSHYLLDHLNRWLHIE